MTTDKASRQTILSRKPAIKAMKRELGIDTSQDNPVFTKHELAQHLGVHERTVARYTAEHRKELSKNGYTVITRKELEQFKAKRNIESRTTEQGTFTLTALLNMAMLIKRSKRPQRIRERMMSIVIDNITKQSNKYYIEYDSKIKSLNNRKNDFMNALDKYIVADDSKYIRYPNMVYQTIFKDKAQKYRQVLNFKKQDKTIDTFYTGIFNAIASFETGYKQELKKSYASKHRQLYLLEADDLLDTLATRSEYKAIIVSTRKKMASRRYNINGIINDKLRSYTQAIPKSEHEQFLKEKSKVLYQHIDSSIGVYKRLSKR